MNTPKDRETLAIPPQMEQQNLRLTCFYGVGFLPLHGLPLKDSNIATKCGEGILTRDQRWFVCWLGVFIFYHGSFFSRAWVRFGLRVRARWGWRRAKRPKGLRVRDLALACVAVAWVKKVMDQIADEERILQRTLFNFARKYCFPYIWYLFPRT